MYTKEQKERALKEFERLGSVCLLYTSVASYVKRDLMNQFSNDERLVVSADNVNKAYKHLLLNPDIQRDLTPVSYTHLDVYKRQLRHRA